MAGKEDNNKPPAKMSPHEFAFETRFVVLNYLGQIPSKSSSGSGSSQYASSFGSSSGSRRSYHTQSSSSSGSSHGLGPSISPRPPDGEDQGVFISDSQDQKHLPVKSKGKQSKQRLSVENVQRLSGGESKKAQYSDTLLDSGKGSEMEEGKRQISAILQKRSREAKLLQEIKDMTKYSPSDQHLIQPSAMVEGSKGGSEYEGNDESMLSNTSGATMRPQTLDESQFDLDASERLLPDFDESGVIPHRWLDNQQSLSSDQHISLGLQEGSSPTRPNRLDGLPDIYPSIDSNDLKIDKQNGELLPPAGAGEINEASSPQEKQQDGHSKLTPRYSGPIIPGTGMPAIPENKTVTDLPPLNWTISRDSECSDMDSPVSEVSSLTLSGQSAKSRSSVVELNQVNIRNIQCTHGLG